LITDVLHSLSHEVGNVAAVDDHLPRLERDDAVGGVHGDGVER
jgi:hypothetical protein